MADSWSILGGLSQQHRSEHWPPWRLVETHWVPDLELVPLGVWDGSDRRSAIGHFRARMARILIARRPGASPAASGAYRPSTRREGVRVKGSGISMDVLILITH
jgi:hypothetical protein